MGPDFANIVDVFMASSYASTLLTFWDRDGRQISQRDGCKCKCDAAGVEMVRCLHSAPQ